MAHGVGVPAEKYGWKPFGAMDYGYGEQYQSVSSWIIWALVTWGSFEINPLEAAALLGGSVLWSEKGARTPEAMRWGTGASWVHNVQAGYCWYHYFVKGRRGWGVFLGSMAETAGNLGAVLQEYIEDSSLYSHKAHYEGASIGIAAAFLMDMVSRKKVGRRNHWLFMMIPFAIIAVLYYAEKQKRIAWEKRY